MTPPLLSWDEFQWDFKSNITKELIELEEIPPKINVIIFPKLTNFEDSKLLCESFNMKLILPKSDEENYFFSSVLTSSPQNCIPPFADLPQTWLNIYFDRLLNKWIDPLLNKPAEYFPKFNKLKSNFYNKSIMTSDQTWIAKIDTKTCFLCEGPLSNVTFYLRGFSEQKLIFFIRTISHNIYLHNIYGYRIQRNENNHWVLIKTSENSSVLAEIRNPEFPIGRRTWNIYQENRNFTINTMSLSLCDDSHFSCDEKKCILMSKRCNHVYDCNDMSDEQNCNILTIDSRNYDADVSPPQIPLPIAISLRLVKVRNFFFSKIFVTYSCSV